MGRKTKISAFAIAALLIAVTSHYYMSAPEASAVEAPVAFSPNSLQTLNVAPSEAWDAH